METAIDTEMQPYGAWYTQPLAASYRTDYEIKDCIDAARTRLEELRNGQQREDRYNPGKLALRLVLIASIQLALIATILGVNAALDLSAWEHNSAIAVPAIVLPLSVWMAARLYFTPATATPKRMFTHYLKFALNGGHRLVFEFLLRTDRMAPLQRTPIALMSGAKPADKSYSFHSPHAFSAYWQAVSGARFRYVKLVRFLDLKSAQLAPNLAVVESELKIRWYRFAALLLASAPSIVGCLGSLAGMVILFLISKTNPSKMILGVFVVGPMLLGMLLSVAMLVFSLIPREVKSIRVRKLLVKVNDQWRIFNGELQGAEELDVRWAIAQQADKED
ncbi:MAG: hypothetical protein KDB82_13225 [Planctomycetes bacterium]|nr:hypothetical protein [Planctomycetota bacterium]